MPSLVFTQSYETHRWNDFSRKLTIKILLPHWNQVSRGGKKNQLVRLPNRSDPFGAVSRWFF
ncbi:hypothetical protein LguiB_006798 [Lonicera macranthoides]